MISESATRAEEERGRGKPLEELDRVSSRPISPDCQARRTHGAMKVCMVKKFNTTAS